MTSNFKRMLQAALVLVAVVWAAWARAAADETEPPPADAPPKAAAPVEPASALTFAAQGTWLLSAENLFGYTYAHQSNGVSANTFTLLGDEIGQVKSRYNWPRLAVDMMVSSSISVGLAANFARFSASRGTSTASDTGYEGAFRVGYAMMPGPSLGIWPRLGVTYSHDTGISSAAVTIDALVVAVAAPHLLLTFGPVADIPVYGQAGGANVKFLDIGAYFGITVPL